jgi:micrococcal nuclease
MSEIEPIGSTIEACLFNYKAKIVKVYDGDTVTAEVDLGFKVSFTIKVRLFGIDTPEIRGEERPEGLIARDKVREMILDKEVIIRTIKDSTGKYGRYLGVIYTLEGINLNEWLVENGYAVVAEY